MRRSPKPVHECYDCPLNLGESCAVYEFPRQMWHGRKKCPGYRNEEMYQQWLAEQVRHQDKMDALQRRQEMRLRQAEAAHEDGHVNPKRPERSGFSEAKKAPAKRVTLAKPTVDRKRR